MGVTTKNSYYGAPPIVTNGLIFLADFLNPNSYYSGSSLVYDISGNGYSGSFISSGSLANTFPVPTQGALYFTGSAQTGVGSGGFVNFSQFKTTPTQALSTVSIFGFCRPIVTGINQMIASKDSGVSTGALRDFQIYVNSSNQVSVTFYSSVGDISQTAGGGPQYPLINGVILAEQLTRLVPEE